MYRKKVEKSRSGWWWSWLIVAALVILPVCLGVLQYRWIGEVSEAEHLRMRETLEASLFRLSQSFNSELTAACAFLLPDEPLAEREAREREYASRFAQWRRASQHGRLFSTLAVAAPEGSSLVLRKLDPETQEFRTTEWPEAWFRLRDNLKSRLQPQAQMLRRPELRRRVSDPALVEIPIFARSGGGPDPRPRELEWLIVDLDLPYLRETIIPQLLERHLGSLGSVSYQSRIVMTEDPSTVIYQSDPDGEAVTAATADDSVRLFELRRDTLMRRNGLFRGDRPFEPFGSERIARGRRSPPALGRRPPPRPPEFGMGRWTLLVRHNSGSLEAAVERTRRRNLAVSWGILLLIPAAVAALVQFQRRASRLAELQMQFVAGVSHELRTPLSVMRTAGHNLKGRVADDAGRVRRYGSLIESESEKLTAIVEQVLRFANSRAGRVIGTRGPVSINSVISDAIEADRSLIEAAGCKLETRIAPDLPLVPADANTLKHALENILSNAAKYGASGSWIGVSASEVPEGVEIRIADRGPGIRRDEIRHIFDPFYRGRKAVEDQIHGTGLGLSLAKQIIESHDGTITVESSPESGTTFIVRLPATAQHQHELSNTTG